MVEDIVFTWIGVDEFALMKHLAGIENEFLIEGWI